MRLALDCPFTFRIACNLAAVRQHLLSSFSFLRFRSRTFHNASRKLVVHCLELSSWAFTPEPRRGSIPASASYPATAAFAFCKSSNCLN
jgi:hypothetical protein